MAVFVKDEDLESFSTQYFPFDDSLAAAIQKVAEETRIATTSGINTLEYDKFRQGIEITRQSHRFESASGKIWAGNIKGYARIITYGQALSFTEFENDKAFFELPEFDPVAYIEMSSSYPLPIIFNEGPQQNKEASMEPFTIPYRKGLDSNEGPEYAHAVRGSLEDGNSAFDRLNGFTNRIEQRVEYKEQDEPWPFLDEGQEYVGTYVTSSIIVEGYFDFIERTIEPYDDTSDHFLQRELTSGGTAQFVSATNELSFNLNQDIRGGREHRSAPAGWDVYGPNMQKYGTDSVTYFGWTKGS